MTHPKISIETATVYRAGGRRWLTKRGACYAAARAKIKERCECAGAWGPDDYPITCWYHEEPRRFKILRRLTRIYMKAFN